jgi:hypothetical protein
MTKETNQPVPNKPESTSQTFQDSLFDILKVFWKSGYSYGITGRNEDFYARLMDDFMNLSLEEFIKKYNHQ